MHVAYRLADVDGVLCVVATVPMDSTPELVSHHWPTIAHTLDFLRYHFDFEQWGNKAQWPQLLTMFTVKESRPGEYWIEDTRYHGSRGSYLELVEGGRTASVKTETTPAPRPRCRLPIEWHNGRWFKNAARGWTPA